MFDLALEPPGAVLPLELTYEHALIALSGAVSVGGQRPAPGTLAYLGTARDEIAVQVDDPARLMLLGGEPFPEQLLMWWSFVGRTKEEISEARAQWTAADERFGTVRSDLARMEVSPAPWER